MKKILSMLSALSIIFVPCTVYAEESSTEISNNVYIEQNLETGEISEIEISKNPENGESYVPNMASSRVIITSDERIPISGEALDIFPASAVGVVRTTFSNGNSSRGTGWLFGPNHVATAGHCLYDQDDNSSARTVTFTIGGTTYTASNLMVPDAYTKGDSYYDYAVFTINGTPGNSRGYFGWQTSAASVNLAITIMGFPGDYSASVMAISFGNITQIYNNQRFNHDADTVSGMSGAPVFVGSGSGNPAYARGIHVYGNDSVHINGATTINDDVASLLTTYRKNY